MTFVGEMEAASVAQHVRVHPKLKFGAATLPRPVGRWGITVGRCASVVHSTTGEEVAGVVSRERSPPRLNGIGVLVKLDGNGASTERRKSGREIYTTGLSPWKFSRYFSRWGNGPCQELVIRRRNSCALSHRRTGTS